MTADARLHDLLARQRAALQARAAQRCHCGSELPCVRHSDPDPKYESFDEDLN